MSYSQLLYNFKSDQWKNIKTEDKFRLLQEMENRKAAEQGRQALKVVSDSDTRRYGACSGSQLKIHVEDIREGEDITKVSSYEVLDTFVHETNHAYQEHCIKNQCGDYSDQMRTMLQAEMARDQQGMLYNYAQKGTDYDMQCDELDSNNTAARFLLDQRERYGDDPEYRAYVKERVDHFETVNSNIDTEYESRIGLQANQISRAFACGDITQEQYKNAMENIREPDYQLHKDESVTTSRALGKELRTLHDQYVAQEEAAEAPEMDGTGNAYLPEGESQAATPTQAPEYLPDTGQASFSAEGSAVGASQDYLPDQRSEPFSAGLSGIDTGGEDVGGYDSGGHDSGGQDSGGQGADRDGGM